MVALVPMITKQLTFLMLFKQCFTRDFESMYIIPSFVQSTRNRFSNIIYLYIKQVWEQSCRLILKPTKSCGSDNIHPRVLRKVKEGVVLPLHLIFQESLSTGRYSACNLEDVTALYKKGDRCVPNNYHPIGLMITAACVIC